MTAKGAEEAEWKKKKKWKKVFFSSLLQ